MSKAPTAHNSKPRIAIFSHEVPATTFIENLITGLAEQGFEIYLFGFKKKDFNYDNSRIKVYIFPESSFSKLYTLVLESLRLLCKSPQKWSALRRNVFRGRGFKEALAIFVNRLIILNRPVDIFHFQWAGDVEIYQELFGLLESKVVVSFRGAHVNYAPLFRESLKKAYQINFPKVDAFHSVSKALAQEGIKYGASPEKIKVIYTSVNPKLLQSAQVLSSERENANHLRIISVGRFHWKKGYNYALDAMYRLKQRNIPFQYTIIAAGKIDEEFLFQIVQNGLESNIEIINGLPQEELAAFIRKQDVFLLPSVEEGIANVAIEAMALETLVLTADCGGMTEAVDDGVDGYVVPVRRADLIAEKLEYIYRMGESEKQSMRRAAVQKVQQKFSRERMLKEFGNWYLSLAAE